MRIIRLAPLAAAALAHSGCERATKLQPDEARPGTAAVAEPAATIAEALARSADDRRFLEAVRAAGLEPTLAGRGPYTVLVPSDAAFDKLPVSAREALMGPQGRERLVALLATHVLPGTILAADIRKAVDAGGGKATLATMGDTTLTATRDGDLILLAAGAGGKARLTATDGQRSNGVVHRLDTVLAPG